MASTAYFNYNVSSSGGTLPSNAPVEDIVKGYLNTSLSVPEVMTQIKDIGKAFGLQMMSYEAGPGMKVGTKTDLSNVLLAHADPGMKQVMTSWWKSYGEVFDVLHQFSLAGYWSRYGAWGATRILSDTNGPKFSALKEM